MAKVSGTYLNLTRGVSQQPFEARLDGQHGEQVNMWSDPVNGLVRRRGTIQQHCVADNVYGPSYHELNESQQREYREWRASFRILNYTTDYEKFVIHYPSKPAPSWIDEFRGPSVMVKASKKVDSEGDLLSYVESVDVLAGAPENQNYSLTMDACRKGFAGAVQVGRHVLLYPNATKFPAADIIDEWSIYYNRLASLEIKIGVPNTTYSVKVSIGGEIKSYEYKTPSSSYGGSLDTSDIPYSDPEYQKKVNDRVNAYNSAVTEWIKTAAEQTRPVYIARKLAESMFDDIAEAGGSLVADYLRPYLLVHLGDNIKNFTTSDGGSGNNFVVNELVVNNVSDLNKFHFNNAVIKVNPDRGQQSFYMKAKTDDGSAFGKVNWSECSRTSVIGKMQAPWFILSYNPTNERLGMAPGSEDGLAYLSGPSILGIAGSPLSPANLPQPNHRLVGDEDSSPTPACFVGDVTWVGMFQDRLVLATGGTLNFSEAGNYFNFWRTQTLTVPDKDPVEVYALGSEADTIRHAVIFDKSLLLFGENQQYSIDGRNPLTPSTSTVIQSSSIDAAVDAPPVSGKNLVFFAKCREGTTDIFQIEIGDVSDTSNFTELSLQLDNYLPGKPAQLLYVSSPSILFVRTDEAPHSIFVFRFIDQGGQRLMDSWSRFDYGPAFGIIYGMFYHDTSIYLRVDREAVVLDGKLMTNNRGVRGFDVIEQQSLLTTPWCLPYLDSMRRGDRLWNNTHSVDEDWSGREYPFLAGVFSRLQF